MGAKNEQAEWHSWSLAVCSNALIYSLLKEEIDAFTEMDFLNKLLVLVM